LKLCHALGGRAEVCKRKCVAHISEVREAMDGMCEEPACVGAVAEAEVADEGTHGGHAGSPGQCALRCCARMCQTFSGLVMKKGLHCSATCVSHFKVVQAISSEYCAGRASG